MISIWYVNLFDLDVAKWKENCLRTIRDMKNSTTRCYVFDVTDCAEENFGFGLAAGDAFSLNKTSKYSNNVAGLAVQTGCYLKYWTGNEIYCSTYVGYK